MKLSVIVVSFDMQRELPRTLQSLARDYQEGAMNLDYEVLLIDNGSPNPPTPELWSSLNLPLRYFAMDGSSASPAAAINRGLAEAAGEIICLMVDGAHILTPGVFRAALSCYRGFENPVVAVRYFYLGNEEQPVSVTQGYNTAREDALLRRIDWPTDGYRLFEIGTPLRHGALLTAWLNRIGETNCLFLRRSVFQAIGGADERFDLPGGGFLNLDICKQALESPGVTPVQLIGEGSFHQLHGGITTNSLDGSREASQRAYREQYRRLRGNDRPIADVQFHHFGQLRTRASNITARERRRARDAGKL